MSGLEIFILFHFWGGGFSLFVFLILQGGFASHTKQFKNGNWDSDVLPNARTSTKMSPVNWQARSKWQTLIHRTSFWKSNTSLKDLTACLLHFEMLGRDFHRYPNLAELGVTGHPSRAWNTLRSYLGRISMPRVVCKPVQVRHGWRKEKSYASWKSTVSYGCYFLSNFCILAQIPLGAGDEGRLQIPVTAFISSLQNSNDNLTLE